jgi:hypothetical protein
LEKIRKEADFNWTDWEKPQKNSVTVVGLRAEI